MRRPARWMAAGPGRQEARAARGVVALAAALGVVLAAPSGPAAGGVSVARPSAVGESARGAAPPTPAGRGGPPSGVSLTARQEEWRRLQDRLRRERLQLTLTRRQERRVADEVERLDRDREVTERRLTALAADLARVRRRADAAAAALARAEMALARQRAELADRLLDANRYGRAGYLDVVLGAASFSEFVTRARLVGAIIHHDTRLIRAYASDRERTAALREQLEAEQAEVQAVLRETGRRRQALEDQWALKRQALRRVMIQREQAERAIREMEEESAQLEALLRRLQTAGPGIVRRLSAGFLWPLRGPLTSRFGWRVHPLFRRRHVHTGIDIAAPRGEPVRAAAAGTVIFAGWYGGYGKLVVIDHDGGTSTLYGHLSAILVRGGERVRARQVVGRVGSTGFSTGPHLHFEVRQHGRPVDPLR